jgi:ABC-type glycerol-3-phosphate transport system substrate-binding protein
MGKAGFWLSGAWEGTQNIPPDNPAMVGHFGVEPFPAVPGGTARGSSYVWGNYNVIPKGAKNQKAAFEFIAWLAGYGSESTISKILPKGGWIPSSPSLASTAVYKSWLKANPFVDPLVNEMGNPASQQMALTSGEAEYDTAATEASQYIATKKMSPQHALSWVDSQANKALTKSG